MATSIPPNHAHNFAGLKCPLTTLICREKTVILGDVTIGGDCVIHPTVQILARHGPIIIGNNNLIEERVNIINNRAEPMVIGDHNVFEVDAHCESPRVGNHNIMESKSRVGMSIELSDYCIIGAGCTLPEHKLGNRQEVDEIERLTPNTVISGKHLKRTVVPNLPPSSHSSQLDFLRKILPNYQKLWRPANLPLTPEQR